MLNNKTKSSTRKNPYHLIRSVRHLAYKGVFCVWFSSDSPMGCGHNFELPSHWIRFCSWVPNPNWQIYCSKWDVIIFSFMFSLLLSLYLTHTEEYSSWTLRRSSLIWQNKLTWGQANFISYLVVNFVYKCSL